MRAHDLAPRSPWPYCEVQALPSVAPFSCSHGIYSTRWPLPSLASLKRASSRTPPCPSVWTKTNREGIQVSLESRLTRSHMAVLQEPQGAVRSSQALIMNDRAMASMPSPLNPLLLRNKSVLELEALLAMEARLPSIARKRVEARLAGAIKRTRISAGSDASQKRPVAQSRTLRRCSRTETPRL